jgi:hypothetical protein
VQQALMLVRTLKETWHRDLVARPETHAWVLSLYRAGELHPQTVDDYFPLAAAEDPTLRDAMARHAADEARHVKMYDRAIAKLGVARTDHAGLDVFNVAIRTETEAPFASFAVDETTPVDTRRDKLAHFLAHAHFLEARIARSLELHLDACERAGSVEQGRVVGAVLADEERHTGYTRDAVFDLLPRPRALVVLEVHRRGEARANLSFSARQVRRYLRDLADDQRPAKRALYRACAGIMEAARASI